MSEEQPIQPDQAQDQTQDQGLDQNQDQAPAEHVTQDCAKAPINPRWMFKLLVIGIVVFAVGAWGFWDASSVYPSRGKRYASYAQYQYLEQAKRANDEDFGIFIRESSVTNPQEEYDRLSEPETKTRNLQDAANSSSNRNLRASMFNARLAWLEALKVVGQLDAEHTTFDSPQQQLETLKAKWQSAASIPNPLHAFDLIVQWMIMALCWTIAMVMFVHIVRVRSKRYSWEAQSMTLTIPGGHAITPEDLEEVDKRKWDKFIVFLKIKDGHSTLGGKEISVDTYQRQFVEDWILAMEDKAFGSQEESDEA
ncbi:MAG: hypothetical protein ACWA5W_09720 [Phycisphaerales bacterium]